MWLLIVQHFTKVDKPYIEFQGTAMNTVVNIIDKIQNSSVPMSMVLLAVGFIFIKYTVYSWFDA